MMKAKLQRFVSVTLAAVLLAGCSLAYDTDYTYEKPADDEAVVTIELDLGESEQTEETEEAEQTATETSEIETETSETETQATEATLDPDGTYTTAEDVALYIHTYGTLPSNFMTKKEARELGWEGGSLEDYAPGMCIGGDYFGNYEGLLPEDREYHECDINTLGASSRGAQRLIYSDDGLIYYTGDHYESFTLLYGEE